MALDFEKWLRERLTEKRYGHSLAVRERAVLLARLYGEDEEKAAIAGLLHDCCKCLAHNEQLKIIESRGIIKNSLSALRFAETAENGQECHQCVSGILLDDFMLALPQLWHGAAASVVVEDALHIHDADILSAIRLHSTGAKEMTRLEKIIYLADLTSADRTYPDVQIVRDLSEQSLDKGMMYCLKYIINMLLESGAPIVRDTWEAYNYFWKLDKETGL